MIRQSSDPEHKVASGFLFAIFIKLWYNIKDKFFTFFKFNIMKEIKKIYEFFAMPFGITFKEIKLYIILTLRPISYSLVFYFIWYLYHKYYGFNIPNDNDLNTELQASENSWNLCALLYGMIATWIIYQINEQDRQIQVAFRNKDKTLFIANTCTRISSLVKWMLLVFSGVFVYQLCEFPFYDFSSAFRHIFINLFLIFFIWEVTTELNDVYNGLRKLSREKVKIIFGEDFFEIENQFQEMLSK